MKFKDFFSEEGKYFIDGATVTQLDFKLRRLKECFHRWAPIGDSNTDGECRDCGLQVIGGKKVLD